MGRIKPIDTAMVKQIGYDLMSPEAVGGEYIEEIGAGCSNPNGYTAGSLFLGKLNGEQHLYVATAAINAADAILIDTNCRYSNISEEFGSVKEQISSVNEALSENKADKSDLASINITGTTNSTGATITNGTFFYLNGSLVRAKTDIANEATLTANTNYEGVTSGSLNALTSKYKAHITTPDESQITVGGNVVLKTLTGLKINTYYLISTSVVLSSAPTNYWILVGEFINQVTSSDRAGTYNSCTALVYTGSSTNVYIRINVSDACTVSSFILNVEEM